MATGPFPVKVCGRSSELDVDVEILMGDCNCGTTTREFIDRGSNFLDGEDGLEAPLVVEFGVPSSELEAASAPAEIKVLPSRTNTGDFDRYGVDVAESTGSCGG